MANQKNVASTAPDRSGTSSLPARAAPAPLRLEAGENWLVAQPHDVLFFRGGRPFGAGDNQSGHGAQLPWPSTLHGFLRTHLAEARDGDCRVFQQPTPDPLLGNKETTGALRSAGPFVATRRPGSAGWKLLFAAPADLVEDDPPACVPPSWTERVHGFFAGGGSGGVDGLGRLAVTTKLVGQKEANGFVTAELLSRYLAGVWPAGAATIPAREVFAVERRIGIARDPETRTVEEGRLYSTAFLRLLDTADEERGLAFLVDSGGVLAPDLPRTLPLGGERRYVDLGHAAGLRLPPFPAVPPDARGFVLYLATPAAWQRGWLPDWLDDTKRVRGLDPSGALDGARLLGIAAGVAEPLSGWDFARQCPKPNRMVVPAGAVYRFGWADNPPAPSVVAALQALHGTSVADHGDDRAMGWALALVGFW